MADVYIDKLDAILADEVASPSRTSRKEEDRKQLRTTMEAPSVDVGPEQVVKRYSPLERTAAVAVTALDVASMTTGRHVMGILDVMRGIGGEGGDMAERYNEGYERADETFKETRESLPLSFQLLGEVAGSVKGGPKFLDDAISVLTRKFAPNWQNRAVNYATTYLAGIPVAAADRYMRNDESFEDSLKGGLFDSAIGTGLQVGAGDIAAPFFQRMYRKVMGPTQLGSVVGEVTESALGEGMTLGALYDATSEIDSGQGVLDLEIGDQPRWETARRFYNMVADTMFPNPNPRRMGTKAQAANRAVWQETNDTIRGYADEANEEAVNTMHSIIGEGGRSDPRAKSAKQEYAAAQISQLERDIPNNPGDPEPLGATPINARETIDNVRGHLEKVYGRKLHKLKRGQEGVWNAFVRSLRGKEIEANAMGHSLIPSKGVKGPRADEIIPEDATVADLYSTRKEMAALLTPTGRIDANPLTKENRKTIVEILNVVDDELAMKTGNVSTEARALFASEMRVKDAEEIGYKFFKQRSSGIDDEYLYTDHYREALEDFLKDLPASEKHAFRKGFSAAMTDDMSMESPLTSLGRYLGDLPSGTATPNALKEKKRGRDHLELVYSKEEADALVDMYTNGNQLIEFRGKLSDLFSEKMGLTTYKPKHIGADLRPQDLPPASAGGDRIAMLTWLSNMVRKDDKKKVQAMIEVLSAKGPALRKVLRRGIEEAAPGGGVQIGTQATSSIVAQEQQEDGDIMDDVARGME